MNNKIRHVPEGEYPMRSPVVTICMIISILTVLVLSSSKADDGGSMTINVSSNGRYFVDRNGKPLFWQGDTEWELFHFFTVSDARSLLEKRRDQGFNVIQVMATGLYPEASRKWGAMKGMKAGEGIQAWLSDDPLTPNEDYFKRMDAIVAVAAQCEMILVIGVYHAADQEAGRINLGNAQTWARWLAQRYKNATNVVWSMYPHAVAPSEPVIRATVEGLREGDGGAHLITMHPDPSPQSSSFLHAESWLSFNTLQTWNTDLTNYDMVRADYTKIPAKPAVDGEARYEEEDGTTPLEVRRAGYWASLAGGFYSYGHGDNWMSPQTWRNWWDTPGASQMKVLGRVFRSIEWWKLVPDQTILVTGIKGDVAARSAEGDWILAYLTSDAPVTCKLNRITASNSATGWWIDPLTGARTKIGGFTTSEDHTFSPPHGWQDAILLLEKQPRQEQAEADRVRQNER
jgi:hypothetical protein